jgi:hypothetical protein
MTSVKKEIPSEVRLVVEVDGNPVGFLNLDIDRLWPLISHRKRDTVPVEWIDAAELHSVMRAAVIKRMLSRFETHLYKGLGDEMVKAELDIETLTLKVESMAQAFGTSQAAIDTLVAETGSTKTDFYNFFWEFLLRERDVIDLKKEWKAWRTPHR